MNPAKMLPPRPARVLERSRLVDRLAAWEDKKLVIIHGQAGQGKSTLASSYLRTLKRPSVWYNMDREDDDPAVFLSCLGRALQQKWPAAIPDLPGIPRFRYRLGKKSHNISRWVAQAFGRLTEESLIVFDDYNITSTTAVHHILKILIESTPPHIRFILLSRMQPDVEVARLRARRAVAELTGDDLRFSDDEVKELFALVFGMHLNDRDIRFINNTAEGWAAGLVLMHEYLMSRRPEERQVLVSGRHLSNFKNQVFDYLAQEVFLQLPQAMQSFLLRTSVVDHLTEPLIELLTGMRTAGSYGSRPGQKMLDELRRKNLFVTVSDDGPPVVRYHALFREFLRKKFVSETNSSEVRRLYGAAAGHFERSGDIVRTINLLIESGQFDKAATRLERYGSDLLSRGMTKTILRWIEEMPREYADRPWFVFFRAVATRFTDPAKAFSLFGLALRKFEFDDSVRNALSGRMLSLAGLVEACFYTGGDFKRMERAAAKAALLLERRGRESAEARARLLLAFGTACFFTGRLAQGSRALKEALVLFRKTGDYFYQIQTAIYLAPCAIYSGDFRLAREAVQSGFEAYASIPDETSGLAALYMAQAMTSLFEGKFGEAQDCINKCHSLAHEYDLEALDFLSLDIGGWLKTAASQYDEAERLLMECKQKARELNNAFFHASASHLLAINYLHQDRLDEALAEALHAIKVRSRLGSRLFSAVSMGALGAVYAGLGKRSKAENTLRRALSIFRRIGACQQEAGVLLVLARLKVEAGETGNGLKLMNAAFSIARQRGFAYFPLSTPQDVRALARIAAESGMPIGNCILPPGMEAGPWLRIYCLGGFRVERNQAPVTEKEWKGRLSKTLLKLLAAGTGRGITRDAAIEALWPEHGDRDKSLLTSLIYRLRKIIDRPDAKVSGSCIVQEGNLLCLHKEAVWTDVRQFLLHIDEAARLKDVDPTGAMNEYEKAFGIYKGELLPEEVYDDWAVHAREVLRSAYFKAIEEAAGLSDSLGDKGRAAALFERLFLADPCNENACRWLMSWYIAGGRRGEALRIFERCERALRGELDVEPDAKTMELYRAIIGG